MILPRRLMAASIVAALLPLTGCGDGGQVGPAPAGDGNAGADQAKADEGILPDPSGSRVRGAVGEAPPPPPPAPDAIVLPKDGGSWPWNLAPAPPPVPSRPITIPEIKDRPTGLAVRPEVNRAVITINVRWKKVGEPEQTRVLWCDTAGGQILAEWNLTGPWVPLAISPDGQHILARGNGYHAKPYTAAVWTISSTYGLKRRSWVPHSASTAGLGGALISTSTSNIEDHDRDIVWGGWVGNRILTSSKAGQFRVVDPETLKHVGTIDGAPARPAISPDGTKAAFLVSNGVVLVDPATCTALGTRRTGPAPNPCALAFSPDGKTLAIGGHEKVTFLDLGSGDVRDVVYPKSDQSYRHVPESFGWAGDRNLFSGDDLYDLDFPIPVWRYLNAADARCAGRQTWILIRPGLGEKAYVFRPFELPHETVAAKVAEESAKPGVFLLKPGDGIAIDVSAIPASRQAEVREKLERRLQAIGYHPDQQGTATIVASIDPPRSTTAHYIDHKPIPYTETPARLKLVKDGKVLWEQARAVDPPFAVYLKGKQSLSEYIYNNGYGAPSYSFFSSAAIPAMFRGPKAPILAFGISELRPDGIKDRESFGSRKFSRPLR